MDSMEHIVTKYGDAYYAKADDIVYLPRHRPGKPADEDVRLPVLEHAPEGGGVRKHLLGGQHGNRRGNAPLRVAHRNAHANLSYVKGEDAH